MADVRTGSELELTFPASHPRPSRPCPTCGDPTATVAIIRLAYAFEECDCPAADYVHLNEVVYHRDCLPRPNCQEFRPFLVRGRINAPQHFTAECHVCGRLEPSHIPVARQEGTLDG